MSVPRARLLISCPDRRGIIASVAGFIAEHHGNVLDADQHTDPEQGRFFMRAEIELSGFDLNPDNFEQSWTPLATAHDMQWQMNWGLRKKRMGILVSRESHCFHDLLWRWKTGELEVDVSFVASNHADWAPEVVAMGLPFHHLPVTPESKPQQEQQLAGLIDDGEVDFVVLARYMQILSPAFVARYPERIINIHHSFLPAFAGRRPYHQAFDRGVKLIGATSHYVTDVLDDGPIISQNTLEVGHRDTVEDLIRKGRDLERVVLARAVRLHTQDKILVSGHKTVVFE